MAKLKTISGAKKRFTLTGSGKIKRKHAYHSHILTKKTKKQKRNLESLEEEDVDEGYDDYREDDGIEPFVCSGMLLPFLVSLFPKVPVDLFGNEDVEYDTQTYEPPVVSKPYYPKNIEQSPECELCPTVTGKFLQAHCFTCCLLT